MNFTLRRNLMDRPKGGVNTSSIRGDSPECDVRGKHQTSANEIQPTQLLGFLSEPPCSTVLPLSLPLLDLQMVFTFK